MQQCKRKVTKRSEAEDFRGFSSCNSRDKRSRIPTRNPFNLFQILDLHSFRFFFQFNTRHVSTISALVSGKYKYKYKYKCKCKYRCKYKCKKKYNATQIEHPPVDYFNTIEACVRKKWISLSSHSLPFRRGVWVCGNMFLGTGIFFNSFGFVMWCANT